MSSFAQGSKAVADLKTSRLRLVAITPAMLDAERRADGSLGKQLRASITSEWPPEHWEPHVFDFIQHQIESEAGTEGWNRYVLLRRWGGLAHTLIGCVGGFVKPERDVEIGYSTLPEFQRKGYATEAVHELISMLFADAGVASVSAQTFPRLPESIKVMERCGLSFTGPGDEEGTVRYRKNRV